MPQSHLHIIAQRAPLTDMHGVNEVMPIDNTGVNFATLYLMSAATAETNCVLYIYTGSLIKQNIIILLRACNIPRVGGRGYFFRVRGVAKMCIISLVNREHC